MCDENKHMRVLAMVVLAKCLFRQFKYKSEEMVLKECQILMKEITLVEESLLIYTQFGCVFSEFCKKMHLKAGQEFLLQVIEFCNANNIKNYSLLRCYDSCMKYQNSESFLEHLNLICFEKGILSKDELLSLDNFIKLNRSEMEMSFVQKLEMIHKRMKSVQRTGNVNVV